MSEVIYDKIGRCHIKTKYGGEYITTKFAKIDGVIMPYPEPGTKKYMWEMSEADYNNFLAELGVARMVRDNIDINYYTKEVVEEAFKNVIKVFEKYLPKDAYVVFDNNVVLSVIVSHDSSGRYTICAPTVYGNILSYDRSYISQRVAYGEVPMRFGFLNTSTVSSTPWVDFQYGWYLSGAIQSGGTSFLTPSEQPAYIFKNESGQFVSWNITPHSLACTYIDNNGVPKEPRDTSMGMSFENWSKIVPIADDRYYTRAEYPFFKSMLSYYGDIDKNSSRDEQEPGGNSDVGGGDGNFDDSSDEIPIPGFPDKNATGTKMITLLKPSPSQLEAFSNKMWSDFWAGIARETIFYGDPADIMVNLSFVPLPVEDGSVINDLKVAGESTGLTMTKAATQYEEVDCGTLSIKEYWGSFMDYSPFTTIELFLPFCGTITLATDEVMNSVVHIVYHVDLLTGSCIAFVHVTRGNLKSVLYQMNGNVAYNIPITGDNFSKLTSTLVNIATGGISTVAQKVASDSIASHAPQANNGRVRAIQNANATNSSRSIATSANAVADVMTSKPSVTKTGNLSANNGIFGVLYPYITITRPRQSLPTSYAQHYGHLSNITETLSELSGYTVIEAIHLEGLTATEEEKSALESLLCSGIIL